jgi:hypothetical protein
MESSLETVCYLEIIPRYDCRKARRQSDLERKFILPFPYTSFKIGQDVIGLEKVMSIMINDWVALFWVVIDVNSVPRTCNRRSSHSY